MGKVTTAEIIRKEQEAAATAVSEEEDQWIKPSEVSRDRVRHGDGKKRITEFEKAQAAFAKAEEVGIEEAESGIVLTRMLRASEVRELMEGVMEMPTVEESIDDDEPIIGPPPIAAPSPKDLEEQILGSQSAYVDAKPEPEFVMEPSPDARVSPELSNDFSSSKYEEVEAETVPEVVPVPSPASSLEPDLTNVTTCPSCGDVINVDAFEYPREVYSAMGAARIKQARFFVVQGKYDEAQKIVRIARAMFIKAGDDGGVAEINKLVDSLARRG
ncbi:MAG: hypothetical protein P1Q69_19145 [Candidatus Thorarchaeota archaeon]|nr:hypothetical protein [Candidatus Thorarchaeota archaeon]